MKIIYYIIPVIAGWILDLIIGDPHCIYHPVRLIGWLIGKLDKMLYKDTDSNRKKYYKGMLLWVLVMLATGGVTAAGLYIFYRINVTAGLIAESVMCYQLIAAKSLKDESMKVYYRLKENNIEIVNRQELGIYTKITNFQFIKSVIYIFAIFILLLIANSAFIWKITIKGNYSYTAEQMIDYVHEKGVKEGVLKESIDTESLEKSIRKNFDDISWVCVEVKGTNLIIHIKENYITEISVKEDKPYDLVAECDCTIVSALVRRGKLNVNPKEKVKKGQVLITGVVDVTDESGQLLFNEYCNADGEIIGQIKEKYEEKLNIKYQDRKSVV